VPPTTAATTAASGCLARLGDPVLAGQIVMPIVTTGELGAVATLAAEGVVGGIALLGRPTRADLAAVRDLDGTGPAPLLVASDEEGGRVQRLGGVLGALPAAGAAGSLDPAVLADRYRAYAEGLAELGVDVAFAPVVDVGGGPGIGDRAFAADPERVAELAAIQADAYRAAGLVVTLKHFPGHGRATADTHLAAATTPPIDELRAVDLVPYERLLADDPADVAVMVGHLDVPGLTGDRPASVSPDAIAGELRDRLGFDGLVVTDSLSMDAITDRWPVPDAAVLAVGAGADVALFAGLADARPTHDALVAAVADGRLDRDRLRSAAGHVLAAKGVDPCALAG
jgi:beta-N-acetylhexosaminidase